jgi:hypothetical protein
MRAKIIGKLVDVLKVEPAAFLAVASKAGQWN